MEMKQKLDIFPWDIFKSDTIPFFNKKILKYFNDFQNQNFLVLWLKGIQTIEIKQNQLFFMGHIQIWHQIFLYQKILKYFNTFKIEISQFYG